MTYRTPEEERRLSSLREEQDRQHASKEENEQKKKDEDRLEERAHRDRVFRETQDGNRRVFKATILAAIITCLGTLIAAGVAAFVALGKKVDPSVTNTFFGDVYQGAKTSYKLLDPRIALDDVLPRKTQTINAPTQPTVVQQTVPLPTVQPIIPNASVTEGSCTGLNEQRWNISIGQVNRFTEANGFNGYSVNLNLKNLTDEAMTLQRNGGGGELTDDQGHTLGLASSSISPDLGGYLPTLVDPKVALPVNFRFSGHGNTGTTISFTVNLYTAVDGGKTRTTTTLGCTALPVHMIPK